MDVPGGLHLFNEKADKLESLSFTRRIFSEKSGVKIAWRQGEPLQVERQGPDDEAVDAFILTLRFFVQDNEESSFRRIAQVYDELPPDLEEVEGFRDARDFLNRFLDQPSIIAIGDQEVTRRRIFEVFMWGGLAHANPDKKRVYDEWAKIPFFFPLAQNEFIYTLAQILRIIFFVRGVNRAVIAKLEPVT